MSLQETVVCYVTGYKYSITTSFRSLRGCAVEDSFVRKSAFSPLEAVDSDWDFGVSHLLSASGELVSESDNTIVNDSESDEDSCCFVRRDSFFSRLCTTLPFLCFTLLPFSVTLPGLLFPFPLLSPSCCTDPHSCSSRLH